MNSWFNEMNVSVTESLRLLLSQKNMQQFKAVLLSLHAADQAAFFLALEGRNRQMVLQSLQPDEFAGIFQKCGLEDRKLVVIGLDNNYVSDMLKTMAPREAAAFLKSISKRKAASILHHMELEPRSNIELYMKYPAHTVGAMMNTTFRLVSFTDTVEEVLSRLRFSKEEKHLYNLYAADENLHLAGVVSTHLLLQAPADSAIESLMSKRFISIHDYAEQTTAVEMIKKYNLQALPVTDKNDVMVGIITMEDILNVLEERSELRIQNIAALNNGLLFSSTTLRAVSQRLPWLIGLTLLGFMVTDMIAPFIASLQQIAMLAIFIPVILGMSGNSGIQSLSVVIRRMAINSLNTKERMQLIGKEMGVGLLSGIVCGLIASLLVTLLFNSSFLLGIVVGAALSISILIGTMTGAALPLIVERWKVDPAVASGPVVTTINDILALFVYYAVAVLLIPLVSA